MFNLLRTFRLGLKALAKMPEPRAVALGVALGLAVGVVPKGNLLAASLGVLMCSLRLSLVASIATAVLVSQFAYRADPLFDAVGGAALERDAMRPAWTWLAARPYADWLQFNNTVVCGSFLLGAASIYPVYRLLRRPLERWMPPLTAWVKRSVVMKVWGRFELAGRLGGGSLVQP